jgi:hypothetical protein
MNKDITFFTHPSDRERIRERDNNVSLINIVFEIIEHRQHEEN